MDTGNSLGEYLRARRELTSPERVGLPALRGRRRVPGLRREEVAMLAGVSADYYIRLEQGRDKHPSDQVLEALSRVLDLGPDGLDHVRRLAGPAPVRRHRTERVAPGLLGILESLSGCPALIMNRQLTVLAANPLATAINPVFAEGRNLVHAAFLDPVARERYTEWETVARNTVASLRAMTGADVDDPQLTALVGELSIKSPEFRTWWARHDVAMKTRGTKKMENPLVGPLTLSFETLAPLGSDGQYLVDYQAEPNSPSAQALALLGSLVGALPAEHDPDGAPQDAQVVRE